MRTPARTAIAIPTAAPIEIATDGEANWQPTPFWENVKSISIQGTAAVDPGAEGFKACCAAVSVTAHKAWRLQVEEDLHRRGTEVHPTKELQESMVQMLPSLHTRGTPTQVLFVQLKTEQRSVALQM